MSPAEIIARAAEQGVQLTLLAWRSISERGDQLALDRWLSAIVSIGSRNVATFETNTPQAYYDAFAVLVLVEKHTGDVHANA